MLSLVAYQSSDDSESDTEETSTNKTTQVEPNKNNSSIKNNNSSLSSAVFTKTKEAVKITVPSLKEFEDDEKEEPSSKKLKKSSGSGLISMLPPPKYSKPASQQKSFMPYVLTKKQVPSSNSTASAVKNSNSKELPEKPASSSKPLVGTEFNLKKQLVAIEDDDQSPVTDFFSLQEPKCSFPTPVSNKFGSLGKSSQLTEEFRQNSNQTKASSISLENTSTPSWSDQPSTTHVQYSESTSSAQNYCVGPYPENESSASNSYEYPEFTPETTARATDEGFLKLQGKKRKGKEEIKFIDVSVDDQLSDRTQWLTKNLTQELVHRPSRRKNDMPTQLQKRKHQITYLAFQAKERELELKNQWSQNRLTKRETQAKYGF